MRYGIFADTHGNIEAFDKVISLYKKERIGKYLCAGDIVGYGANPVECINRIKKLNGETVCGNHDRAVADILDYRNFNPLARKAVDWTRDKIGAFDRKFLKNLPVVITKRGFHVVHGSLSDSEGFPYILSASSAVECFETMNKGLCFVGHTHAAGILVLADRKITSTEDTNIRIKPGRKYIINVGSVGQPRDRDPRAAFCVFDTEEMTVEIKRVSYDIKKTMKKIVDAGLPGFLARRLSEGR